MQQMTLTMIGCGMVVKRMGMLGVTLGKVKALTVKMETALMTDKDR